MKQKLLVSGILAIYILSIVFTGFKFQDGRLFYYAFKEKIYLQTVSKKIVVRYQTPDAAKSGIFALQTRGINKTAEYKDDRTAVIDLQRADSATILRELQNQSGVITLQPLYSIIKDKIEIAVTNEIVIKFSKRASQAEIDATLKKHGLQLLQKGEVFNTYTVGKGVNTLDVANAVQESGLVDFSHPNFYLPLSFHQVPNDEYFGSQWNLHNTGQIINDGHTTTANADINAPEAWSVTMGSSSITIAVLDEGVTSDHPDLPNTRQVRLNGSNFSPGGPVNDPSPVGDGNHGNACAGIIAATRNNAQGIAGIAPNCNIMPIKILNPGASIATVANAFTFAKNSGAHVISNSYGTSSTNPNLVPAMVAAIQDAVTTGRGGLGCVVVFSAGNTADHAAVSNGIVTFPSNVNVPGVITVGSSDRYDNQANYSPTSNPASGDNQIVDLVAPSHKAYPCQIAGETFEVWSIDMPGTAGYNSWHGTAANCQVPPATGSFLPAAGVNFQSYTGRMGGTSASCPEIAAAAALVLSVNPALTQQQVFDILTANADKTGGYTYNASGFSNELGFGRLNLYRSVEKAGADLYVKDQTTDTGIEANPDNTSAYYLSPDVWVRPTHDLGTTHDNPEAGQTNYVYVKVINRGYLPSAGSTDKIKLYWAKASTGLSWPNSWTTADIDCSGTTLPLGRLIGEQTIAAIPAGGFATFEFPWIPPIPADYTPCFGTDNSHFCLLARIETSIAAPFGMTFPETAGLGSNVKNNNNIAWKNVSIVNVFEDMSTIRTSVLITGSKFLRKTFTKTDLRFTVRATNNNIPLLKAAAVDIDLGDFTKPWIEAGGRVEGGKIYTNNKGRVLIRVDAQKGTIYGIPINASKIAPVTMVISPVQFLEGATYGFNIEQFDGKTLLGGEGFDIRYVKKKQLLKQAPLAPAAMEKAASNVKLKTWQTGEQLMVQMDDGKEYHLTITNNLGQVMNSLRLKGKAFIPVGSYQEGIYHVRITGIQHRNSFSVKTFIR